MKKTIVVIGGSSGIGLETSKLLSSKEYEVIIGSRKPLKNSKINHFCSKFALTFLSGKQKSFP